MILILMWTAVALLGLGVSLSGLLDTVLDYRAQRRAGGNGQFRLLVWSSLGAEALALLTLLCFVATGVAAGVLRLAPELSSEQIDVFGNVARWSLFAGVVLVVADRIRARVFRRLQIVAMRRETSPPR